MSKKNPTKGRSDRLPTLDLHGYTVDAVPDAVDRFLVQSQNHKHLRIRIITGKGTGAVRTTALAWLKRCGFSYWQENEGSFLIYLE